MRRNPMYRQPVAPPNVMESVYGPKPKERVVTQLDLVSVEVGDLFPEMTDRIYRNGDDITAITNATTKALSSVDMTMIKPEHTVKLLSSEHGYSIMGGEPYVRMLEAIKDNIRSGQNVKIHLMVEPTRVSGIG
jgi:hypothetical protein